MNNSARCQRLVTRRANLIRDYRAAELSDRKFLEYMGATSLKVQRAFGRQTVPAEAREAVLAAANNSTILDDSFSEAMPLSDSSDEDEAEDINPRVANKKALIQPLLNKRKTDAKCGVCSKGFVWSKKTWVMCSVCQTYYHWRHFPGFDQSQSTWHCNGCRRPSSTPVVDVSTTPDINSISNTASVIQDSTGQYQ